MSDTLESVGPSTPLAEAAAKMLAKKVGCLPVLGEGRTLAGILTRSDLLRHFVGLQRHQPTSSQAV
ncbi:MAG: CBS domain-containing protein [Planctomycetia bacterium]|nr:CBS domain-containing protein [Planctomycetia bacterium]